MYVIYSEYESCYWREWNKWDMTSKRRVCCDFEQTVDLVKGHCTASQCNILNILTSLHALGIDSRKKGINKRKETQVQFHISKCVALWIIATHLIQFMHFWKEERGHISLAGRFCCLQLLFHHMVVLSKEECALLRKENHSPYPAPSRWKVNGQVGGGEKKQASKQKNCYFEFWKLCGKSYFTYHLIKWCN